MRQNHVTLSAAPASKSSTSQLRSPAEPLLVQRLQQEAEVKPPCCLFGDHVTEREQQYDIRR